MKNLSSLVQQILFVTCITLVACKKEKNEPEPAPIQSPAPIKSAKFEITGNYSGHLFVVYTDNVSGNTTLSVTALPWSKTVEYPNTVMGIGIGGNGSTQVTGVAGQTVSLKIYNGNTVVKSGIATADANGLVNLPPLAYVFP